MDFEETSDPSLAGPDMEFYWDECGDCDQPGECDGCDELHCNASQNDHCVECGNCWVHCSCTPKRTPEDNWLDAVRNGYVPGMGSCDECGAPHEDGNQIDHCAVCGNCWEHCVCTPQRTPADNLLDAAREGFVVPE